MSGASDLLLHLTPCPVEVTILGRDFDIPALDAVAWLRILTDRNLDLYQVFPGLAGDEAVEAVEDALWDELATTEEVDRIALDVISMVADRPWWVVLRVLQSSLDAWDRLHVNNATGMSLAGWFDELWAKIMMLMDPKRVTGWVASIEAPPKGWEQTVDFDAQERAFLAAMRSAM